MKDSKLIALIVSLVALTTITILGVYITGKKQDPVKPTIVKERIVDTLIQVHDIVITNTKMGKNVYIDNTDTIKIKALIYQTDSLESIIVAMKSGVRLRVDSIVKPHDDTVSIVFDKYKNKLDSLIIKHKPVGVQVIHNTQLIEEPVPMSRYFIWGGSGLVAGILLTLLIGK